MSDGVSQFAVARYGRLREILVLVLVVARFTRMTSKLATNVTKGAVAVELRIINILGGMINGKRFSLTSVR